MVKPILLVILITTAIFSQTGLKDNFVKYFNAKNFGGIAGLYRYPENQDTASHNQDSLIIAAFYAELYNRWGKITKANAFTMCDSCILMSVTLSTADSSFWNHQEIGDTLIYKLTTSKKDSVLIGFRMRKQDKKMKIGYFDIHTIVKKNLTEKDRVNFRQECVIAAKKLQTEFNEMINRAMIKNGAQSK